MGCPLVMGVVNVTPDSFSDGGRYIDPIAAIAHGLDLVAQGADVIDVGGESTRPGAAPVPADLEAARVVPVIEGLRDHTRVSIDTRKAEVAAAAVAAGATLINDVSATLAPIAADLGVGWIAMHMLGTPETMQREPSYTDVTHDVLCYLLDRAEAARAAGIVEVWIDPGIGFGKTLRHNLVLLRNLKQFVASGFGVLVGTSRKSFLGTLLDGAPPEDRLEGTLATAVWAATQGVAMVRVHDVAPVVQAMRLVAAA